MINAAVLARMQQIVAGQFDLVADIQRNQSSTIVIGQKTENWQSILPGGIPIPCWMKMPTQAIATQYASLIGTQQASVFTFAAPLATQPQRGDRIIEGGITWTMQADLSQGSYPITTPVLATRIG